LPVTFGTELNYRTEKVIFDVVKIPLPYNGILGRPALAKFMAASHYTYNTLKMPGPMSIITIHSDKKDAVIYTDKLYREAVAASAIKALAPAGKSPGGGKKKKTGKTSDEASGKRTPARPLMRPSGSAPQSAARPLRTYQRALPARAREPRLHHLLPSRSLQGRMALAVPLP
jgi:hypothetical protein